MITKVLKPSRLNLIRYNHLSNYGAFEWVSQRVTYIYLIHNNVVNCTCAAAAAAAKSLQSCSTLCDPIDGSPLGSSVPGILQARILEWVAISFSNAWKFYMWSGVKYFFWDDIMISLVNTTTFLSDIQAFTLKYQWHKFIVTAPSTAAQEAISWLPTHDQRIVLWELNWTSQGGLCLF